jgi:hypothetical protein
MAKRKADQFVLPEMGLQAFVFVMFLVTGHWFSMLLNLPIFAFNVRKVMDNSHMYDATEIFRTLSKHKKESFIKVGFYALVSCFIISKKREDGMTYLFVYLFYSASSSIFIE